MNNDKKFTVMVVDDIQENIDILSTVLGIQYEVSIAMDGKSALARIDKEPPDLILLDVMMPEMDGFEVCRQLKDKPDTKDIPIIFLTAKTDGKSIVEGFQAGAVDYIGKPFNVTELLVRVKTQLELAHSRKEMKRINARLEHLTIHDDLTGLYNTRYLYDALYQLVESSKAENRSFALLFMDIDNFKYVVDTCGHLNGSRALREIAETIMESISEPCYGVAYGGDEFVIVLPGFDKDQAIKTTETIRTRMKATKYLKNKGCDVQLSASFGIAAFPDDATEARALLKLADQLMFRIKETSKDAIGCLSKTSDSDRSQPPSTLIN
ncbi:MAG: diguanylate cyclase [Desulfobacterales bacterium]|nr:diguanylate cyclase [Desulfobacterales bacterium]